MPTGKPITPAQRRRYDELRSIGWSVEPAADAAGFSRSKGYLLERERNGSLLRKNREPIPSEDLGEAVALIIAERNDNLDAAFAIVDRFGALIVPFLCNVAWTLARERASNENRSLKALLEDTPMAAEHAADPVTPEDVLNAIPVALRGSGPWYRLTIPRVEAWRARMVEMFPELADIEAEVRAAEEADDSETAMTDLIRDQSKSTLLRGLG